MAERALIFIAETLVQLWTLAVMLRLLAQLLRVPFRARAGNPIVDFVIALTDWIVIPGRRFIPSIGRLDTTTVLVAWGAMLLLATLKLLLLERGAFTAPFIWPGLLAYSFVEALKLLVYLLIGLIIVQAVISWISPYHPLRPFFDSLTRPVLKPFQKMIPLIGGVDLSPLFAILALQLVLMLPVAWLGSHALLLFRGAA
ncbi:MAG: YggT family protein [Burkholderiales bacterium]|jgi:YggT family protein|nr:YggT family protein [Nitrosomonadaceae bacterium]